MNTPHLKQPTAKIYRIHIADYDEEKGEQELFVVRLDKENSCILGKISASKDMNVKARQLADDMTATYPAELNDGGTVGAFLGD